MKSIFPIWLTFVGVLLTAINTQAAPVEGTWKLERSVDYESNAPAKKASKFPIIKFQDNIIQLSENCTARLIATDYLFPEVFQAMTKEGISETQVDRFLVKNFGISLLKTKMVYKLKPNPEYCASPVMEFFVVNDKILIPAGDIFYIYGKTQPDHGAAYHNATQSKNDSLISGYKLSRLPMDFDRYYDTCRPKITNSKGKPQTSDKCAPEFFPYVADPKSDDPLMKLVGNHNYTMGGHRYADGFSPPFKQKAPATFLVFTPMNQVVLLRVDDFEVVRNEERDIMAGVYLSVVNGKVVDQISGCHLNLEYVCLAEGQAVAKLAPNGKFQKITNP
ncbi:hypothetical protein [Duganella sp. Root336D2]|uniref:hypothetical protein n=1 Tax=Duganella sp. Root336D2 TaxID=1736518 RepID=UPI000A88A114|nr:hypothetical protein [Duganella sp. Root336D2]